MESVLKKMLLKAHFFLNQSEKQDNIKITYHPKLEDFENEPFGTVKLIKFRKVEVVFQTKLEITNLP